jgi:hypothetical protein
VFGFFIALQSGWGLLSLRYEKCCSAVLVPILLGLIPPYLIGVITLFSHLADSNSEHFPKQIEN